MLGGTACSRLVGVPSKLPKEAVERSSVVVAAGLASGQSIRRMGDRGSGGCQAGCEPESGCPAGGGCELPLDGLVLQSSLPALHEHTQLLPCLRVATGISSLARSHLGCSGAHS